MLFCPGVLVCLQSLNKEREGLVLDIARNEKVLQLFRKVIIPTCSVPLNLKDPPSLW